MKKNKGFVCNDNIERTNAHNQRLRSMGVKCYKKRGLLNWLFPSRYIYMKLNSCMGQENREFEGYRAFKGCFFGIHARQLNDKLQHGI